MIILELKGHVPSKKNNYRSLPGGGGVFVNKSVQVAIDALTTQATYTWRLKLGRDPLEHPKLTVQFFVANQRSDRDNKLSCLLDVLQKAGVLVNDSIRRCNGVLTLLPAIVDKDERTVIEIEEQQIAATPQKAKVNHD